MAQLYDQDFYLWIEETHELLKNRKFDELDLENLLEEIAAMGRSEKRELKTRLVVIIEHLLKLMFWDEEREYNQRGWKITVTEQKYQLLVLLQDSPSLRSYLDEVFLSCYKSSVKILAAMDNFPINRIPETPPFSLEEIINE
ncbi:DUF29 domain-containing protein [Gloeothece verrucosa]|uniref:DUF29 domain-containing protein n=1 Tax=Gloeothece verrucosa (strain PCC 7822) TaxID=497965 RepID=E0U8T9_GLOV7|nr:DUF29 domain-containing protein [Gloeothece verrucosa]ADN14953.1 protein of unknown function DUF29 [Gloeothece verrucosa PCC 7822]